MTKLEELEGKLAEDPETGLQELSRLISEGNSDAMYVLGMAHYDGDDVERDTQKTLELLERASEEGHVKATHDLGCFYYGLGFPEGTRDLSKSTSLLERSASKGFTPSMTFLGSMYKNGEGVEKNLQKAEKLFRKAADEGDELGTEFLAGLKRK